MSLVAVALVVAAGAVHAAWNALAKRSGDKLTFFWTFTVASLILYAVPMAVLVARHPPRVDALPFVVLSSLTHVAYYVLLARAYRGSDLSFAYPVARGTGVLLVPLLAVPIFGDRPTPLAWLGIAGVVVGILWLHAPALRAAVRRAGIEDLISGPALLTGLTIACYSLIDTAGVRRIHPLVYLYLLFLLTAIWLTPYIVRHRWGAVRAEMRRPGPVLIAGAGAFGTYLIVLTALRLAPVAYVVPIREISIVFGAVLGTRLLGEPFGSTRVAACVLVVAGIMTIGIGG